MASQVAFSQDLICGGKRFPDRLWKEFVSLCEELGYKVRVTGGNDLTHEVNCTQEELNVIFELGGF